MLRRSLEIATFGSGAARDVGARGAGAGHDDRPPADDRRGQGRGAPAESAGTQLAENPRIEVDGQDRARLLAGDVDTRIALVLAQFVTAHRVTVTRLRPRGRRRLRRPDDRDDQRRSTAAAVPSDGTKTGVLLRFLSDLRGDLATQSIDATDSGITAGSDPIRT